MSLSSLINRDSYVGNDLVSVYSYTFKIFSEEHLKVTVRSDLGIETSLALGTDYTVDGVGNESGGSITLVDADQSWLNASGKLKEDYVLVIRRVVPLLQETEIRNQGSYFAETHEDVFDRVTMMVQQLQDSLSRCVTLPETITDSTFLPTLPSDLLTSTDKFLSINPTGNGFKWLTAADVINAAGLLAMVNNLSDVSNKPQALINLGIAPLSLQTSHAFTNNQSATALTGESYSSTAYKAVVFEYLVERGVIRSIGRLSMSYNGSAWELFDVGYDGYPHGLTFSLSGGATAQLMLASDNGGDPGVVYLKKHTFTV